MRNHYGSSISLIDGGLDLREMFKIFDKDHDGYLSASDLKSVIFFCFYLIFSQKYVTIALVVCIEMLIDFDNDCIEDKQAYKSYKS